ncbi:MAG: hypothetical protein M0D57_09890 [Sphingobacteriales bacterium JAD_PAG50586_3]|nr:MAG: hypothetical protein M0D57_09890 [Sphingobacteriales bacterium JAD_PAG50586_3]
MHITTGFCLHYQRKLNVDSATNTTNNYTWHINLCDGCPGGVRNRYFKQLIQDTFFGFARGRFYFNGLDPRVEVKIAWWHKEYDLITALKNIPTDSPEPLAETTEKTTNERTVPWRKVLAIIRSFKVEKFSWHLDTGDFALNGELYGLFAWYRYTWGHDVTINFTGDNYLLLTVKNSAWRVLKTILKTNKTKTK